MAEDAGLQQFAETFLQETISGSDIEDTEAFREDQFTQLMIDYLIEAGEIDDAAPCYHKARGIKVNAYGISQDQDCLDLFISIFNQVVPPVTVNKTQIENGFRQASGFLQKALSGYHLTQEESSPAFDMVLYIHDLKESLTRVRLFLLTDGFATVDNWPDEILEGLKVSFHIWDISRLYRFWSSGKKRETIEIDFEKEFNTIIPCLSMPDEGADYDAYLAIIPGNILAAMYKKYGARLLERNVRSFLQARGKVNKGIRDTILNEPHRFLAYNNGISVTADAIRFGSLPTGGQGISWARNFQIVNGGQTTASIYHTAEKDKADISSVFVQTKVSVVPSDKVENIVPLISRYANSQNKVSEADFSANDPFHVKIEELSRTIWAPAEKGTTRQTRWFYERARGQYLDAKARETTPARKKSFESVHPASQKFTKTDLAKYENTWNQLPHVVSLGAEKNFREFTIKLQERGRLNVDNRYFEHLIAKAILFKRAEKIVQSQNYGGYRANIVTYSLSYLAHKSQQRIDLSKIWQEQNISHVLAETLIKVSQMVWKNIVSPPGGRNITEWCKKKECWEAILNQHVELGADFINELIEVGRYDTTKINRGSLAPDAQDLEKISKIMLVTAETWFKLSAWAKQTNNLQPWQRGLSYSLGRLISRGATPSRKQAEQGLKIIEEASQLGFKAD